MRILHTVEFYHPSVGGMQEVVKQLSERLVKLGYEVTVATTKLPDRKDDTLNGVKIREFSVSGNMAKGFKGDTQGYRNFLLNSDFDVVTNFAAQQWATDVALTVLDDIKAKKVFVPTGFSGLYMKEYQEYFEKMKNWMKKYDMNVFLSEDYRDINFAKENNIIKRVLIPNGAGEDEFLGENDIDIRKKLGIPENHFLVLHVGSHTGVKGHKEAIRIFQKACIKNATFLIIANKLLGGCTVFCAVKEKSFKRSLKRLFDRKKMIITALSRKETVAAYKAADLFLFPSNIECSPIVLFECMAAKTSFLTSDVGNAKEIIEWSEAGILLPTEKDKSGYGLSFVDIKKSTRILEEIYRDKNKREVMEEKGHVAWKEEFSWEKIVKQYESLYKKVLGEI